MKGELLFIGVIAIFIAILGLVAIYSSTYHQTERVNRQVFYRQIIWISLGLALFFVFANFNYRRLADFVYPLYIFALILLIAVWALGAVRLGAQRWLRFAWFNFQPSEFAKIVTVIFLSWYFSRRSSDDLSLSVRKKGPFWGVVTPLSFIAVFIILIMEQPDLGSAILLFFIFMFMAYVAGLRLRYVLGFVLVGIVFLPIVWCILRDYQRQRLIVFLNPNIDPLGAGYTIIQSQIALGAGGLFGRGLLSGTQSQLHFLPESHTDFIFANFAESWGFAGCLVLLSMYYLLFRKGFEIAFRTTESFGRLLAYGITFMLAIQTLVNISMNLGLAPVVGIPLPLMSYGGSSIIVTFIALGILANIAQIRSMY